MKETPVPTGPADDRVGVGIASVLGAVFLFSVVDVIAKWLGQGYPAVQILFFRYFFGLFPVAVFVWLSGGLPALRTRRPYAHAVRAGLLFVALLLFFEALRGLALAEAIAVAFTAPLFVTALARPVLGETVGPRRWAAVVVGFLGALIMVRPGTEAFRPEALLVLGSAFSFSLLVLLTRRMTRTETNVALLAYSNILAGAISLPFVAPVWRTPAWADMWLFLAIGLVGTLAAFLVIRAYRHAPVSVLAPFEYSALVWGTIFGWVLWRDRPELPVWVGAAVIVLATFYITRREAAAARAGVRS